MRICPAPGAVLGTTEELVLLEGAISDQESKFALQASTLVPITRPKSAGVTVTFPFRACPLTRVVLGTRAARSLVRLVTWLSGRAGMLLRKRREPPSSPAYPLL